jgi:ATP-binding cassette subfamily F protein 3
MPLLSISDLRKLYGPDVILDRVGFQLEPGEHVALVGANGTGKSTLLRIIAGLDEYDSGQVSLARNAIVTYVAQEARFESGHSLWDAMMETFAPSINAQKRMRQIEEAITEGRASQGELEEYREVAVLAEHEGYDYDSRIERVLYGLELDRTHWRKPVTVLSGGQKTRANLARALLKPSDLLLLDEPTNHLDISALQWLEEYLRGLNKAFIVVAHDRYFLERVSKRTLELAFHKIEDYPASYNRYLVLREERRRRAEEVYRRQQEHIAKTEEFVRRFGAGQRSKEAKGRQKQLDRLERVDRPKDQEALKLDLGRAKRKGDAALRISAMGVGYKGHVLLNLPDELVVRHGARVAIVGPNGAGKTTLARTLVNTLPAIHGSFHWAPHAQTGYYAQAASTQFRGDHTVLQAFQDRNAVSDEAARNYLGRFLFTGDEVQRLVGDLSGGEQSRLALACLLFSHPAALVLDEPTNHLDIGAREALETALHRFQGTVILISHDRFLIDRIATEIWNVNAGQLEVFDGNWTDFVAGRNMRKVSYSDVRAQRTEVRPPDPDILFRLTRAQEQLSVLAGKLAGGSATASVEQLELLTNQYAESQAELASLADSWLPERTNGT